MAHFSRRLGSRTTVLSLAGTAVAASTLLISGTASAQRWAASASVEGQVTATDNGTFDARGEKEGELSLQIAPRISFRRAGGRLRVDGDAALSAFTYVQGTQSSRIDPALNLIASLEALEDAFFIETSARVQRTLDNPFGPQTPSGSSFNTQSTYQARISPYLTGELGSRVRYQLRSDTSWTRSSGGSASVGNQYATRQSAVLSVLPRPLGLTATFDRDDSDVESGSSDRRTAETARLIAVYSPNAQWTFGLRGGHERNNYPGIDSSRDFYGANLTWRPTERTTLSLLGEKRFFGNGWEFAFDHRMPRLAWTIRSSRNVSTLPQRFLGLPVTQNVAALIDASLVTRFPDPIDRARAVEDIIISRGLPRTLLTAVDVFTERIELQTSNTATVTIIGARSTLAFTLFSTSTEGIAGTSGGTTIPQELLDNRQRGVGISVGHQLSSLTTLSGETSWRDTRGLGGATDERSRQQVYSLRVARRLSPDTTATGGARYQVFDSTNQGDTTEAALFIGLSHRF